MFEKHRAVPGRWKATRDITILWEYECDLLLMKQWANRKCDVKKRNSHRHFSTRFCKNGVRWRNKEVTSTVATVLSLFNQKGTYLVIVTKYNRAPFLQLLTGPWSFPEYTSFLSNSFEDYRLQLLSEVIHSSKKLFKSPLFEHTYAQRVAFRRKWFRGNTARYFFL